MKKKIINVNYGIASVYDNIIEVNIKLKGSLRQKIIAHELRHDSGKYTSKDFRNDFQSEKPYFFESLVFALKNPEALVNYFFLMYSYYFRQFTINFGALFHFVYFGIIFTLFFTFLFKIPIFNVVICWFLVYLFINLILITYTHFYVKLTEKFIK